jgi:tetrahydromethanopterin S-methyltransferase subunit D
MVGVGVGVSGKLVAVGLKTGVALTATGVGDGTSPQAATSGMLNRIIKNNITGLKFRK